MLAADIAPLAVSETVLGQRLFPSLRRGTLLLADRVFRGFDLWRAAAATSKPPKRPGG